MPRKSNSVFTSDSAKHIALDNVEVRVLETAMRNVAGLPVSDEDRIFVAHHMGTVSALWTKFKQFRTAYESVDVFAQMMAAKSADGATDTTEKAA